MQGTISKYIFKFILNILASTVYTVQARKAKSLANVFNLSPIFWSKAAVVQIIY